jgi:hypothetical protein
MQRHLLDHGGFTAQPVLGPGPRHETRPLSALATHRHSRRKTGGTNVPTGISPDSDGVQRELCTVSAQPAAWLAARRTIGPIPRPPAPGTGGAAWGKRLKSGESPLVRRIGRRNVRHRVRPGLRGIFAGSLRDRSSSSTLEQYEQRLAIPIPERLIWVTSHLPAPMGAQTVHPSSRS